jgi:protein-S-isoprenylcysteine O-methyltransferase Ste14
MPQHIHSITTCLIAVLAAVGAYHRIQSSRTREPLDRSREGWPLLIAIRLLGLLGMAQIVWALTGAPPAWMSLPLSVPVRWLGVLLLSASVVWLSWMFRTLGRNLTDTVVTRRDAHLVQHGPYRYVRNPMYTGLALLGVGLGLALANWPIPATVLAVFTLLAIRTKTEEVYLISRFGEAYREYMRHTGRFVPFVY